MSTGALFHDEIAERTGVGVSLLMLSERVLARWWRLVAFMKAMNLIHWAMRTVFYCRIATAIEMASKGGGMLLIVVLIVFLAAAGAIRSE
jgi:hypothetical protein